MDASLALKKCSYVHYKYFYIIQSLGLILKKQEHWVGKKYLRKNICFLSLFWLLNCDVSPPIRSAFTVYLRILNNEIILIE